jgi:hypothetical protein
MKQHNKAFLEWAYHYMCKDNRWFSAHELLGEYVTSRGGGGGTRRYIGNASSIGAALRFDSRFTSTKMRGSTVYKVVSHVGQTGQ